MATAGATFRWQREPAELVRALDNYRSQVIEALGQLADLFAAKLEAAAKAAAPWTDQTGAARQGLTGLAVKAATGIVIYLFHTMFYGIFLELKNGGRYAVIMKTLESMYGEIMSAARALVGGR